MVSDSTAPSRLPDPSTAPPPGRHLLPGTFTLALVLSGLLAGLLTYAIGSAPAPTEAAPFREVIECSGFATEAESPDFGGVWLANPAPSEAVLDLYFLDAGRTVLRSQHVDLIAGAQMSFGMPTREMGSTIRVVGSEAVEVQVTVVSSARGGVSEHRPLACSCHS
jgi:hypothetical protein